MVAARELDGEMMVMSSVDSTLFTLNEIGTAIWKAADGVTRLSEVIEQKVCAMYEIAPEIAAADVEQFVQDLANHGVLLISDNPITTERQRTL